MSIAILSDPACLLHEMGPHHPENPLRLKVIEKALFNADFKQQLSFYHQTPSAQLEDLYRIHDKQYVEEIFRLSPAEGLVAIDLDTFMNPYSLTAALHAAGAATKAVDLVMNTEVSTAFCNTRPAGHHAERA